MRRETVFGEDGFSFKWARVARIVPVGSCQTATGKAHCVTLCSGALSEWLIPDVVMNILLVTVVVIRVAVFVSYWQVQILSV